MPRDLKLDVLRNGKWESVTGDALFADRRVVLFGLPGAYTPTCSSLHLPRFDQVAPSMLGVGVDANDQGRQQGSKVSLYDTNDDLNPRELDTVVLQSGWFNAGSDPHAFTWDAERSIATIIGS